MPLKGLEVRYASRRSKDYKLGDGGGLYLLVRPTGSRLWAEARLALARGEDPGPKAAAPVTSFEAAARAWHGNRVSGLEPGHAARILSRLERDVFPSLGERDLQAISAGDVLTMLRAVEARGALDVSQVYLFAIPQGWATHDPAAGLATLLRPKPRVRHMARVGAGELRLFGRSTLMMAMRIPGGVRLPAMHSCSRC